MNFQLLIQQDEEVLAQEYLLHWCQLLCLIFSTAICVKIKQYNKRI